MTGLSEQRSAGRSLKRRPVSDEARFFRGWLQRPLVMGAVSPSSKALGRAMASYIPDPARFHPGGRVLELGPGTGVVTQCLIERGVPESSLVLVEYSREFCVLLRARFPTATVIEGDAYALETTLPALLGKERLEGVVSSLPLFTKPEALRERMLSAALARLESARPFIQFSYAWTLPVRPTRIGAEVETSGWIKRNLPPARVLVYRAAMAEVCGATL